MKLYRKMVQSAVFQDPGLFQLFMWLLLSATHKKRTIGVSNGRGVVMVELEPGQVIFGRHVVSRELKQKGSTLADRLKKLEKMENVVTHSTAQFTIATIVNWHTYQGCGLPNPRHDRQATVKQPSQTRR